MGPKFPQNRRQEASRCRSGVADHRSAGKNRQARRNPERIKFWAGTSPPRLAGIDKPGSVNTAVGTACDRTAAMRPSSARHTRGPSTRPLAHIPYWPSDPADGRKRRRVRETGSSSARRRPREARLFGSNGAEHRVIPAASRRSPCLFRAELPPEREAGQDLEYLLSGAPRKSITWPATFTVALVPRVHLMSSSLENPPTSPLWLSGPAGSGKCLALARVGETQLIRSRDGPIRLGLVKSDFPSAHRRGKNDPSRPRRVYLVGSGQMIEGEGGRGSRQKGTVEPVSLSNQLTVAVAKPAHVLGSPTGQVRIVRLELGIEENRVRDPGWSCIPGWTRRQ